MYSRFIAIICAVLIILSLPTIMACAQGDSMPEERQNSEYDYLDPVIQDWLKNNKTDIANFMASKVESDSPFVEGFVAAVTVEILESILDNKVEWEVLSEDKSPGEAVSDIYVRFFIPIDIDEMNIPNPLSSDGSKVNVPFDYRRDVQMNYSLKIENGKVIQQLPDLESFAVVRP
jgi:hypothetical protein